MKIIFIPAVYDHATGPISRTQISSERQKRDAQDRDCCYLLQLPRELRDKIYEYVLYRPCGFKINTTASVPRNVLGLTPTSKQIRQESFGAPPKVNTNRYDLPVLYYFREYQKNQVREMRQACEIMLLRPSLLGRLKRLHLACGHVVRRREVVNLVVKLVQHKVRVTLAIYIKASAAPADHIPANNLFSIPMTTREDAMAAVEHGWEGLCARIHPGRVIRHGYDRSPSLPDWINEVFGGIEAIDLGGTEER